MGECGLCVAAVLAPYAPLHIVRGVFHGKHLACPPFVQVWTTSSDWPTLTEFVQVLDTGFNAVSRRPAVRKTVASKSIKSHQSALARKSQSEPEPEVRSDSFIQNTSPD